MNNKDQAIVICKYIVDSEWKARRVWTISRLFSQHNYDEVLTYFDLHMGGCGS